MRITYDKRHGIAYVYVNEDLEVGWTVHVGGIVIDVSVTGELVGFEILEVAAGELDTLPHELIG